MGGHQLQNELGPWAPSETPPTPGLGSLALNSHHPGRGSRPGGVSLKGNVPVISTGVGLEGPPHPRMEARSNSKGQKETREGLEEPLPTL